MTCKWSLSVIKFTYLNYLSKFFYKMSRNVINERNKKSSSMLFCARSVNECAPHARLRRRRRRARKRLSRQRFWILPLSLANSELQYWLKAALSCAGASSTSTLFLEMRRSIQVNELDPGDLTSTCLQLVCLQAWRNVSKITGSGNLLQRLRKEVAWF